MWRLCLEDDQQNRTVVNLVRQSYSIGRAEDNAIRLTERNVSRRHARLERSEDGWVLTDLNSETGCFVGERQVEGSQAIGHGDRIRIGDYLVILTDESRQDETVRASPIEASVRGAETDEYHPERRDRLVVIEGPNVGATYPLSLGRLLLGRGDECDIALNDTSVSRVHADIESQEDGQYRISDQGSSNGLRVNGQEVPAALLDIGDVIELGDVFLKYVPRGVSFDPTLTTLPSGSRPPPPSALQKFSSNPKLLALTAAGGLLLGLLVFGFRSTGNTEPNAEQSPGEIAMAEASRLFAAGDLEGAHRRLSTVASSSNVRESATYRKIEAAWADDLFERAQKTDSEEEERRLLSAIASSQTVDALRRRRAAERLEQVSASNIQAKDLPPAKADAGAVAEALEIIPDIPAVEAKSTAPGRPAPAPGPPKAPLPKRSPAPTPTPQAPVPTPVPEAPTNAPSPAPNPVPAPVPAPSEPEVPVREFPGE